VRADELRTLRFELTSNEVAQFAAGSVHLVIDHPACLEVAELTENTTNELLRDLS
jgi:hypothetical protein